MEEKEELKALVQQQKKIVEILHELASKVNTNLQLSSVLQSTFELLNHHFGYEYIMIFLIDEDDSSKLRLRANFGYNNEGIGAEVLIGQGVVGTVAKNKRLLRMANVQLNLMLAKSISTNSEIKKLPGIKDCSSQLAVPLMFNEELVGVVNIETHAAGLFQKKDEDILKMIGVQIGIAINNTKQFETIERTNKELSELNETLEFKVLERTKELLKQKELVQEKNQEIFDSITYAKRIQQSLLPTKEVLAKNFYDYFVYYEPKDIVSGDFYWFNKQGKKVFFLCADCTGHGVPGAFVSMIGAVGMRRAVIEMGIDVPAEILDSLNEFVERTINTSGNIKDGMDIALICIDYESSQLSYSGANNGVLIVRNNEFITLDADKQPIGSFDYRKPFTNHQLKLQSGDRIYATSDGYIDQFGGQRGKKFMRKRFKSLILENQQLTMREQEHLFKNTMESWIGNGEQIDDICVFGVEFRPEN